MKVELARALFERGLLKKNTEVLVEYIGHDVSMITTVNNKDIFSIDDVKLRKNGNLVFAMTCNRLGNKIKSGPESILEIDGMSPNRLARAYNIRPDGGKVKTGKKRGRKSKKDRLEAQTT